MHTLSLGRSESDAAAVRLHFDETLDSQIVQALQVIDDWGLSGSASCAVRLDGVLVGWGKLSSSLAHSLLLGCAQHGWPFAQFARACLADAIVATAESYEASLVGTWDSDRAFAETMLAAAAQPWGSIGDDGVALDDDFVEEVCSAFECLRIDGATWVFDVEGALATASHG